MGLPDVLKMGDARLLATAASVDCFESPDLNTLLGDMRDTMQSLGGVGLAAPQLGVALRVIMFGVHDNPRYPEAKDIPETILINPEISVLDHRLEYDWEGCLSLPGLRGRVPRYQRIRYSGFNGEGDRIEREVDGFHARVVQHEYDHLEGILYPMRIEDMREFGFEEIIYANW